MFHRLKVVVVVVFYEAGLEFHLVLRPPDLPELYELHLHPLRSSWPELYELHLQSSVNNILETSSSKLIKL